jgi:hypothetical protein
MGTPAAGKATPPAWARRRSKIRNNGRTGTTGSPKPAVAGEEIINEEKNNKQIKYTQDD